MSRARRESGFTLLELVIALAITGAILVIAFGGLRVGLDAWRRGEERAEVHAHMRGLAGALVRAIASASPYRIRPGDAPDMVILFEGGENEIAFATQAPPVPFAVPIAFTAVAIKLDEGERRGLVIRQRPLPNRDPFTEGAVVLHDPAVTLLKFRYLDGTGAWNERWSGDADGALPRAVQVTVGTTLNGRAETLGPLVIVLRVLQ